MQRKKNSLWSDQNEKLTEFRLKKKEKYAKKINKIQDETLKKKLLDKLEKTYKDKFNL